MEKINIKIFLIKLICVLIVLLAPMPFFACGDGFVKVCYIEFTTDGTKKTIYSEAKPITSSPSTSGPNGRISVKSFEAIKNNIDSKYIFEDISPVEFFNTSLLTTNEPKTTWWGLTKKDKGQKIYIRRDGLFAGEGYDVWIFEGISNSWVSVKVINDATIKIKKYGEETTYAVSQYKIKHLED